MRFHTITPRPKCNFSRRPGRLNTAFAVLSLLAMTGAIFSALQPNDPGILDPANRNPVLQGVLVCIYIITASLLLLRWEQVLRFLAADKLLVAALAIVVLSALWSAAPDVTLRRGSALLGTTAFGVYLALNFDWEDQLRMLALVVGIGACLSVLCVLVVPDIGLTTGSYLTEWRGVYGHKNGLGQVMCFGVVAFFLLWRRRNRLAYKLGLALCLALLLLSGSRTALFSAVAAILVGQALRVAPGLNAAAPVVAVVLVIGAVAWPGLISQFGGLLRFSDRDLTFTGRTALWSLLWRDVLARPWLGYGYGAYWIGGATSRSASIWDALRWQPTSAHNGYFDVLLGTGLIGFALVVGGFVRLCWRAMNLARYARSNWASSIPFYLLAVMFCLNLAESSLAMPNNICWVLYTSAATSLAFRTLRIGLQKRRAIQAGCAPPIIEPNDLFAGPPTRFDSSVRRRCPPPAFRPSDFRSNKV